MLATRTGLPRRSIRTGLAMLSPISSAPSRAGSSARGSGSVRCGGSRSCRMIATITVSVTGQRRSPGVLRIQAGMGMCWARPTAICSARWIHSCQGSAARRCRGRGRPGAPGAPGMPGYTRNTGQDPACLSRRGRLGAAPARPGPAALTVSSSRSCHPVGAARGVAVSYGEPYNGEAVGTAPSRMRSLDETFAESCPFSRGRRGANGAGGHSVRRVRGRADCEAITTRRTTRPLKIAGLQHWCGSNGITCAEPATNWSELHGYKAAVKAGAHIEGYIGHDEPATLFYSNVPGSGNNVTYQMTLPKDPPTLPRNNGSGGTDSFQLHPTFWLGMVMCDPNGLAEPRRGGADRSRDGALQAGQQLQHLREREPHRARATSVSARARPMRRCSSTRRAGRRGRPASAAPPSSGAPR